MSLLEGTSRVALALHYARCGTPLGVMMMQNQQAPCLEVLVLAQMLPETAAALRKTERETNRQKTHTPNGSL